MMTTGYDCPDLLNLGLFRPIFSPTDFIQIKGRGTRKHDFSEQLFDNSIKEGIKEPEKSAYKIFDFFANCEYFEEEFSKFVADFKPTEAAAIPALKTTSRPILQAVSCGRSLNPVI